MRGEGDCKLMKIGGLKSKFSLNPACSTIMILRLDLESLEWEEAGRMPLDIYKGFRISSKFMVLGGGDRVVEMDCVMLFDLLSCLKPQAILYCD
ncbi:hypothetical protein Bca101_057237 [Brassica carinata]